MIRVLGPKRIIVSAFGLREGLALSRPRRTDPRRGSAARRRRSRSANGSAASAIMARRSISGWIRLFPDDSRRHAAAAAGGLPAGRHRLERPSRFSRRARGRHGDPWQLGRDRCAWPRGARPRPVQRVRRRWRVQPATLTALLKPGENERRDGLGPRAFALPSASAAGPRRCCARPASALTTRQGRAVHSEKRHRVLYSGRGRAPPARSLRQGAGPRARRSRFA